MTTPKFVHLHVHSHFSLLDGACKIEKLVAAAEKSGMAALALTDHGNLHGVVQLVTLAKEHHVKPIIGYEAYVAPQSRFDKSADGEAFHHLTLLAKDLAGYHNLIRLSSLAYLEGFYYKPRIDKELLKQYSEGLIALSGCLSSEINSLLLRDDFKGAIAAAIGYRGIFGNDNFFLEIQNNGLPDQKKALAGTLRISKELGIPVVATNDIHYLARDDARAQEVLLCINTGKTVHDEGRMRMETDEFYFKSAEEMAAVFGEIPGALENSVAIAERCNVDLDFNERRFPRFEPPDSSLSDVEYLRKLAEEGFSRIYSPTDQPARDRLEYELKVIADMGYASYFLIVWDFVQFARGKGIPTSMRGSGVGSVVSYVLGLIDLDPLKHSLIFQRFLDPERKEPPDIDVDFCEFGREEVMQYVKEKYGVDNTAQIITFGSMKAKAVVRDVGRALNISLPEVIAITKMIPSTLGTKLKDALEQVPELKALRDGADKNIKELFDVSLRLEGLNRHPSIHAAGVCIADRPLIEHIPVCKVSDIIATQFAMNDLEKAGMLKMDFLGVRFLTIVDRTLDMIEQRTGNRPDITGIPLDDRPTYDLLTEGKGRGVFQMSSAGMRNLLAKLKPDNIEDLIAIVALYRPGPLQSGMVDDFIERKHGRAKVKYLHPSLEQVLKTTYGVIVYQEQIMQIAHELAGLTMAEALTMIKAISKKNAATIAARREKFISGAAQNGIEARTAEEIFSLIEFFTGYGFNKAHSTAYAYLTYRTAYLKCHYPVEFMTATLTCEMGDTERIVEYLDECRQMGIQALPPDINESDRGFAIIGERSIRFGLGAVKGVGEKAIDSMVEARSAGGRFKSLYDFCERVDLRVANKSVLDALIKCGAFDCTGTNRPTLLSEVDRALKIGSAAQTDRQSGQMSLFGGTKQAAKDTVQALPDWSDNERTKYEKETVGLYLTGHPLNEYSDLLDTFSSAEISSLRKMSDKQEVVIGGLVRQVSRLVTKNGRYAGQPMAKFILEGMKDSCSCVIFSEGYAKYSDYVKEDRALFVVGKVDLSGNAPGLRVEEIVPMKSVREKFTSELHIRLDRPAAEGPLVENLQKICIDHPGECVLFFRVVLGPDDEVLIRTGRNFHIAPSDAFHAAVTKLIEPACLEYYPVHGKLIEEAPLETDTPEHDMVEEMDG